MRLLIIGAGGYGRLTREIAEKVGYADIDYLDDNSPQAVGKIEELEKIEPEYDGSIVTIGNPEIREKIFMRLKKPTTIIHPSAVVSRSACIGAGVVIEANASVNSEAVVGDGSYICAGAVVNHNAVIGEFSQVDCNAVVGMGEKVPRGTKINSCAVYRKIEMTEVNEIFLNKK